MGVPCFPTALKTLFPGNITWPGSTRPWHKIIPHQLWEYQRGNRRHRKMQKTIYRVRTQTHIQGRIALDLFREAQAPPRRGTAGSLHRDRTVAAFVADAFVPVGVL